MIFPSLVFARELEPIRFVFPSFVKLSCRLHSSYVLFYGNFGEQNDRAIRKQRSERIRSFQRTAGKICGCFGSGLMVVFRPSLVI